MNLQRLVRSTIGAASWLALLPGLAYADALSLRNGMILQGNAGRVANIAGGESPNPQALTPIIVVDDQLRRTFFPARQLVNNVAGNLPQERIRLEKRVATVGKLIGAVGPVIQIQPFDEFGNRIYTMNTSSGPLAIVQGITEITPLYTRVQGMQTERAYIWDTRIATNSIPRSTLNRVLSKNIDPKNVDDRLRLVRLLSQAERFEDARTELETIIKDFPDLAALAKQVEELRQASARRMLREVEFRRDAGQHRLAVAMLGAFPTDGIAGELQIKARDRLTEYEDARKQGEECLKLMKQHLEQIVAKDSKLQPRLQAIVDEMSSTDLNFNTLNRMSDYLRLSSDEKLAADQKLAIAITGWMFGSGSSGLNLAVAISSVDVRDLIREYLNTKSAADRRKILDKLVSHEAATPANIAKIIANMKPPIATQPDPNSDPGFFELTLPAANDLPEFTYCVQLPPEYDPYRRYPCVVTLGSCGVAAKDQLQWWTGLFDKQLGLHLGQAGRQGYIVVAPQWSKSNQTRYEFSAREHAAVLNSLRDATRRFAIDTDRVFLSGHSSGGDAAWDIGLAHPDLWAGIVPVVATMDKYIQRYTENGRLLPMYFIGGEMDGDRIAKNGPEWDRYMTRTGYDVMIVDYLGRGHEHFQEEIHRIFDWTNSHRRDFAPKEFKAVSMRPWDNFFWFVEIDGLPAKSMVLPVLWPGPRGLKPAETTGKIMNNNSLYVNSAADRMTVWLSPDMVDFSRRININGRAVNVTANVETLLEDVRTRGDRQHSFHAKASL